MTHHAAIYTKTGDKGQTSLFNCERRSKSDACFEALGDVDELNAYLGLVRSHCTSDADNNEILLVDQLIEIQSRLFDVGANLATPRATSSTSKVIKTSFELIHLEVLEEWIDAMDSNLQPLRNFILPGGGKVSSLLHVARAVCRRAERHVVDLVEKGDVDEVVMKYLNRLSDYLFTAARLMTMEREVIWRKAKVE